MIRTAKLGLLLWLAATSAFAADMAVLRNGFAIRHERREVRQQFTRLYFGASDRAGYADVVTSDIVSIEPAPPEPQPPAVQVQAAPRPIPVEQAIATASDRHDLDQDLLHSVIRAESNFNPRAVSPKGARGLMQLMPGTAAKLGVQDSFDTQANVDGGSRYLHDLLVQYDGDLVKALAAYNAGPGAVDRFRGVPPYRETRAYVARIVRDFNRKKKAQQPVAAKAPAKPAQPKRTAAAQPQTPAL